MAVLTLALVFGLLYFVLARGPSLLALAALAPASVEQAGRPAPRPRLRGAPSARSPPALGRGARRHRARLVHRARLAGL